MLEDNVDERYYLSDEKITMISKWKCYEKPLEHIMTKDSICGTLTTRSGAECGGMKVVAVDEPFVVASRGRYREEPKILRKVRTDYGKQIRKEYEKGLVKAKRSTIQKLEPRKDGLSNTITTVQKDNYVAIKTATKKGYDMATDGDGIDLAYPDSTTRRGRVGHGVAKTLSTNDSQGVLDGFRIRKLTPRSCYRLMGFDDASFDRASKVLSNTQLYKTAGNSIVVPVLEAILKELLCE